MPLSFPGPDMTDWARKNWWVLGETTFTLEMGKAVRKNG